MRTIESGIRYRFDRLQRLYASRGITAAVNSGSRQFLSILREGILQSWWRVRYPDGLIERDTEVGLMLLSYRDKGVSRQLLQRRIREPLLVDLLRTELTPGMHGYDIGANIGYYVLLEDSIVGASGQITACEPTPDAAYVLTKNVLSYCSSKVNIQQVAISDRSREIRMSHSVTWNISRVVDSEISNSEVATIAAPATTLDELRASVGPKDVDFIRMDIEGHEIAATKGMTGMLSEGQPRKLFVEVHNPSFDSDGVEVSAWLGAMFDYGLKPRALTSENRVEWIDDRKVFIEKVIAQKRSCVHVFLGR